MIKLEYHSSKVNVVVDALIKKSIGLLVSPMMPIGRSSRRRAEHCYKFDNSAPLLKRIQKLQRKDFRLRDIMKKLV